MSLLAITPCIFVTGPPHGDHHQTVIRGECLLTPGAESRAIAEMSRLGTSVKRSGNLVILRKRGESNIC